MKAKELLRDIQHMTEHTEWVKNQTNHDLSMSNFIITMNMKR